jgi:glutathione S-transferase
LSYRIFGAEVSPYSVKVRSYFRYKGLPHEWILRTPEVQEEYKKYAKLPLIPLVVTPEGEGIQDSTPIIERVEAAHPEPSIHPDDPALAFLSALLEEFADEWANKWMFHYRWWREVDQISTARRLAEVMAPAGLSEEQREGVAQGIRERMTGRIWFVGSSQVTKDQIEASFESGMTQLERHLAERPFLFGGRPAFADFGLWGQVYNASTDPTCGGLLAGHAAIHAWIERMHDPKAEGDFESWNSLEATLRPLLAEQVGALFLPWSDANARALAAGQESFEVTLAGRRWEQKPQKYHARSLAALRKRYAAVTDRSALDPILESTGCLAWLSE